MIAGLLSRQLRKKDSDVTNGGFFFKKDFINTRFFLHICLFISFLNILYINKIGRHFLGITRLGGLISF